MQIKTATDNGPNHDADRKGAKEYEANQIRVRPVRAANPKQS